MPPWPPESPIQLIRGEASESDASSLLRQASMAAAVRGAGRIHAEEGVNKRTAFISQRERPAHSPRLDLFLRWPLALSVSIAVSTLILSQNAYQKLWENIGEGGKPANQGRPKERAGRSGRTSRQSTQRPSSDERTQHDAPTQEKHTVAFTAPIYIERLRGAPSTRTGFLQYSSPLYRLPSSLCFPFHASEKCAMARLVGWRNRSAGPAMGPRRFPLTHTPSFNGAARLRVAGLPSSF